MYNLQKNVNFSVVLIKTRANSFCIKAIDTLLLNIAKTKMKINFS